MKAAPISPEILDAMPEELAELYRGLELTLLQNIAEQLTTDKVNEVTLQNIRELRSHGLSLEEIEKAIENTSGISKKKLKELFDDAVLRNQRYYSSILDLAKLTIPETMLDTAVINAIIKQTTDEVLNITRSMGFAVDSGRTFLPPAKAYQWALNNATIQVNSGVSYNKAIANATRQLADSGLQIVNYESGHRDHVDVAVRRAVMTGINQLNRQYDEKAMQELQTDLVEVAAHAGARDKGTGFVNHKSWQGRIYRWAKYTREFPDASSGNYPDFEETCGLGDVQGILGANCRHNWHCYLEGIMEPSYTEEQLANIDPPDVEYEGKTYTQYEATQQQRRLENTIRKWKRIEAGATNSEDKLTAKARLRRLRQFYNDFSETAGLKKQPERMKAYMPIKKAE